MEPNVSDKFSADWRIAGQPWCDKCGLPARRGGMGITVHVSDAYPLGVPVEKDGSDHTPSMRKWFESL